MLLCVHNPSPPPPSTSPLQDDVRRSTDYQAYYAAHRALNPRLPPPLTGIDHTLPPPLVALQSPGGATAMSAVAGLIPLELSPSAESMAAAVAAAVAAGHTGSPRGAGGRGMGVAADGRRRGPSVATAGPSGSDDGDPVMFPMPARERQDSTVIPGDPDVMARAGGVEAQVERDSAYVGSFPAALTPPQSPDLPAGSLLSRIAAHSRRPSTSTNGSGSGTGSAVSGSHHASHSGSGSGVGSMTAAMGALALAPLPLEPLSAAAAQSGSALPSRPPSAPPATLQHGNGHLVTAAASTTPDGDTTADRGVTGSSSRDSRTPPTPTFLQPPAPMLQSVMPLTLLPLPDADYPLGTDGSGAGVGGSSTSVDGGASPAAGSTALPLVQGLYVPPGGGAPQPYS